MLRILALLLLLPSVAHAQLDTRQPKEEETISPHYSPDFCEFEVTFPSEPYRSRRCEPGNADKCHDLVSYTQVFEMLSTVNFRVICNPIGDEVHKAYSPEVMQATLRAMTKQSVVKEFNTTFREAENYKQAGLVGEGKVGVTPTIYIAQLWIGQHSALSVEGELIGETYPEADQLFSDVLKSVGLKKVAPEPSDKEDEDEDEGDKENEDDEDEKKDD
jgi:hypothetical protein